MRSYRAAVARAATLAAAIAALPATATATADDDVAVLADGSRWRFGDGVVTREAPAPTISITLRTHNVGIGCAAGLDPRTAGVRAAYIPPGFHPVATEAADGATTRATVCLDTGAMTAVFTARWTGALTAADQTSLRLILADVQQGIGGLSSPPAALSLFKPSVARVPLDASTGVWDYLESDTDASSTMVLRTWPQGAAYAVRFTRSTATQRCDSVGFGRQALPAWAPAGFYPYAAARNGMTLVCLDARDGHVLLVEALPPPTAADTARLTALLTRVVGVMGGASPVSPAAPPPAAATPAAPTPYTPAPYTPAPYTSPEPYTSPAPYGGSYSSSYDDDAYRRRGGEPRWRLGLHHLETTAMTPADYYAVSLGYGRFRPLNGDHGSVAVALDHDAAIAANGDGDIALDARGGGAIGPRLGRAAAALGTLGVGFDGFGLGGADEGRPSLDAALYAYYGLRLRAALSKGLAVDGWLTWMARSGDLDETRYGGEITIHRRRAASFAIGLERVMYGDAFDRTGVTFGIRR